MVGELLLFIRDYDESTVYLKWLQYEVKDKSYRHYSHIQELLSITQIMSYEQNNNRVDENMLLDQIGQAYQIYKKNQDVRNYMFRALISYIWVQSVFNKYNKQIM